MRFSVLIALTVAGLSSVAFGLSALDTAFEDMPIPDLAVDFLDRILMLGTAVAAAVVILRQGRLNRRTDDLERRVDRAGREGRAWRARSRRFLVGLTRAVEEQFDVWELSPAEADVAGLLLKGASLREIAGLRRTSEATIRQQAGNVYRKSGLGSRAELSAYFLEDLFAFSEATVADTGDAEPFGPDARYDA